MNKSDPAVTSIEKMPRGDYAVHVTASELTANGLDRWVILWVVAAAAGRMP